MGRKIPPAAEIGIAALSLAAQEDAPSRSGDFVRTTMKLALRRMAPQERRRWAAFVEGWADAPDAKSPWLRPADRTGLQGALDLLFRVMASYSAEGIEDRSLDELLQLDLPALEKLMASPPSELMAAIEHERHWLVGRWQILNAAHGVMELLKSKSVARQIDEWWPAATVFYLRLGLMVLPLAVVRGEWAVLDCHECIRYFAQYGNYHRGRQHTFCSDRCRVAFNRSIRS